MAKILFIMTGSSVWTLGDGSKHTTGYWAEEAAVPLPAFKAAGHQVTVATPHGVVPPVDPGSLTADAGGGEEKAAKIHSIVEESTEFANPVDIASVDLADFEGVYVPGGHGPMEDLADNLDSGEILTRTLKSGTPLGVVCHGAAAMLAAVEEEGSNPFVGYRVAAFTNAEEQLAGFSEKAKWLLQDRLTEAGINVVVGEPFAPNVQVDRHLVTGQNPASTASAAEAFLKLLG